ncbi:MAG: ThiJ/PfpI protein [Flavipsychrobacter sp.]|nr:ThiJ/PfpI protein [Flavipsychrobacter sp.]
MLLFPDLTLLDFVGPYDIFVRADCFEICIVSLNRGEVKADGGLVLKAEYDFEHCPIVDILFVPGGKGITPLLTNALYLEFLQKQSKTAQYVTSVCTGSLLLAAAGLLTGYRATTHWGAIELLKMFGVETVEERIVSDRNRITGGGVTAGIDFGLMLCALIGGNDKAKLVQLALEYDPQPPFGSGSPATAEPHILKRAKEATRSTFEIRREIIYEII